MNRTRSFATAAFMVAIVGGCDPSTITQVDVCPDKPGIQLTGPCEEPQPEIGGVTLSFDTPDLKVTQGDSMPCPKVAIVGAKNLPHGYTLDTVLVLNTGTVVTCGVLGGNGPQLVAGSPPVRVTTVLTIGPHSVIARVTLRGTSLKAESAPLPFTVVEKPKPDFIVTTCISGSYPNRGESEVCMAEDTINAKVARLTNTGGSKGFSAVSPDLSYLLYVSGINQHLWRANMDGSNPVRYTLIWQGDTLRPERTVISPDGKKIAFMASIGSAVTYSAFVMNADGTGLKRLLAEKNTSLVPDLAWMPNGQEIVLGYNVIGYIDDNVGTGVLRMVYVLQNVVTDGLKNLLVIERDQEKFGLTIKDVHQNGDWVMLWDVRNTLSVILLRTDGSREMINPSPAVWMPIFCPNGREICSIKKINGGQVVSMDFNGQNIRDRFTVGSGWIDRLYRVNVIR